MLKFPKDSKSIASLQSGILPDIVATKNLASSTASSTLLAVK